MPISQSSTSIILAPKDHSFPELGLSFTFTVQLADEPISSASKSEINALPNNQFELTISYDIITGVTPQVLHWWFCRIDDKSILLSTEQARMKFGVGNFLKRQV